MTRQIAPLGRRLLRVTGNERLGAYRVLRVADTDGPRPDPGQFAMLAAAERWGGGEGERPYLPRAFSIARWHDGEAHFLLEDIGPGTHRLCELRPPDRVWALGPLGRGFQAPADGRAILVGGGAGIAPLAIWQDALGLQTTALLGFRDAHHADAASLLHGARVATDDGSCGHHGRITDLLTEELARADSQSDSSQGDRKSDRSEVGGQATVYACGPAPMLEAVRRICAERRVPAQLALESGMACGFGACFGCVVPARGGGYLRVCVDGPVIDAAELDCVSPFAGASA